MKRSNVRSSLQENAGEEMEERLNMERGGEGKKKGRGGGGRERDR